jgi:hypothetical protein
MTTAPNEPRRRSWLPKLVLGLSSFGVVVQLLYFLVDDYADEPIREPVKEFVDQHFLPYAALVYPSIFVFGVCAIVMVMQWGRNLAEAHRFRYRVLRPAVYVACQASLVAVGMLAGCTAPLWWVFFISYSADSLRAAVWSAPVVFAVSALGAERFCPYRHRSWLRPLLWGALAASLALLAHLLLVGWEIDMTV